MKLKLTLLFCLAASYTHSHTVTDSILQVLDRTLEDHAIYTAQKEKRILILQQQLTEKGILPEKRYDLNKELYREYKTYICDSAIFYLNRNIVLSRELNNSFYEADSKLQLAYLLASSGMYKEAEDILITINKSKLDNSLLPDYYAAYNHLYGELSHYTQDKRSSVDYHRMAELYKDTLHQLLPEGSETLMIMKESAYRYKNQFTEALELNDTRLANAEQGTPAYALATFHRALLVKKMSQPNQEIYYLAASALSDIRAAIRDHASLWMLAELLYEKGDVKRAYRYIRFSWEETNAYNARLRSLQSAGILSLIDKTYQGMIEQKNSQLQLYIFVVSALSLLLIGAMFYIYRQMKRLSVAGKHLKEANTQLSQLNFELNETNATLQQINMELSESNQIKEEYIARFMKLCSTYIDKLDGYRRMVNKKISAGQVSELSKITRSHTALDEEVRELYINFDTAFLHLFPDFVNKFNALLNEEEKIYPKKDELLNTELRIFALIRLGIEDSSQIAEFLRYSVNTIYNYRAKVKNKAAGSRETFEDQVRKIR